MRAGLFDGDHTTCCCIAERLGLAAKSQPPALLRFVRQRQGFGAGGGKTCVMVLIQVGSAKAFPCESFDRKSIEEVVAPSFRQSDVSGFIASTPRVVRVSRMPIVRGMGWMPEP